MLRRVVETAAEVMIVNSALNIFLHVFCVGFFLWVFLLIFRRLRRCKFAEGVWRIGCLKWVNQFHFIMLLLPSFALWEPFVWPFLIFTSTSWTILNPRIRDTSSASFLWFLWVIYSVFGILFTCGIIRLCSILIYWLVLLHFFGLSYKFISWKLYPEPYASSDC